MSSLPSVVEDPGSPPSSRKRSVRVACCHCRKRKHACNGARPTCTPCVRRNLECVYDTQDNSETRLTALRRQLGTLKEQSQSSTEQLEEVSETFHLLKAIPEDKALQLLKRVRASRDPVAAISSLRRSMLQSRTFGGEPARSPLSPPHLHGDVGSAAADKDATPEKDSVPSRSVKRTASASVLTPEQESHEPISYRTANYGNLPVRDQYPNFAYFDGHSRPHVRSPAIPFDYL